MRARIVLLVTVGLYILGAYRKLAVGLYLPTAINLVVAVVASYLVSLTRKDSSHG